MKFVVQSDDSVDFTPSKANFTDIGYDLKADSFMVRLGDDPVRQKEFTLKAGKSCIVGTGVIVKMPSQLFKNCTSDACGDGITIGNFNWVPSLEVHSRSGLWFKHNIEAFNGQIDNSFHQEIKVKLTNRGDQDYVIKRGDRIAQLELKFVPAPLDATFEKVESIDLASKTSTRGGFGSSGK